MWSKVEGGRKVSRGRVALTLTFSIVQHISSKFCVIFVFVFVLVFVFCILIIMIARCMEQSLGR